MKDIQTRKDCVIILNDGKVICLRATHATIIKDENRIYIFDGADIICFADVDTIKLYLFCDVADDLIEQLMK